MDKRQEKLQAIISWEASKPKTDKDWAEDVKNDNLDVKYNHQLDEMLMSHIEKTQKIEKDLEVFTDWPEVKRYELTKQFKQMFEQAGNPSSIENKTLQEWVNEEFESQKTYYMWKYARLNQGVERIAKERELREKGYVVPDKQNDKKPTKLSDLNKVPQERRRKILGTTYYVDADNGNDTTGNGLAPTAGGGNGPWANLDPFTEGVRAAGDICIVRRGRTNAVDNASDLGFASDGTITNPIIIEADFGNVWSDNVNSAQTYTMVFGSKTHTASTNITGISAGDWVYVSGDNQREFAYEVASVSGSTLTLYLPFKGTTGSGLTLVVMQDNPIWNTAAGDFQWNFDTDNFWKIQGIHIRGTDSNGNVELDDALGHNFVDCIFEGNGSSDWGINATDNTALGQDNGYAVVKKSRFYNHSFGIRDAQVAANLVAYCFNCLFNNNSVASSGGIGMINLDRGYTFECEFSNSASGVLFSAQRGTNLFMLRNPIFSSVTTPIDNHHATGGNGLQYALVEDYAGTVGDNRRLDTFSTAEGTPIMQSETTTVRSGGSNKSIKVTPSTNIASTWDLSNILLFEIPIYADTSSKTYTVYFRPSATGDWSADPTASELWIELEAWGHASNNFRKITKSTGTIDMNGSTAWQSLTVTVAPAQAGVAYLRCWYAKTKEAGSNIFYVDPVPVIS